MHGRYHAIHYKKGKIDRKTECDAYFMEGLNAGWYRIVRSTLVGSVYYAAVQRLKRYTDQEDVNGNRLTEDVSEDERETWAAIFLTRTDGRKYHNFYYKDMDAGYFVGMEVYVWNLPEEHLDGSPYTGSEHNGRITGYPGNGTYLVELYDGNSVLVKEDDLE